MVKKLWEASQTKKKHSNLYKYEKFLSKKYNLNFTQNYSRILFGYQIALVFNDHQEF